MVERCLMGTIIGRQKKRTKIISSHFQLCCQNLMASFLSPADTSEWTTLHSKAQPVGWAFLIQLRHSSFSPQNFAAQTFWGGAPYGLMREAGIHFITPTHDGVTKRCHSLFVHRKPLAGRVVQRKVCADDVERKTPFVVK